MGPVFVIYVLYIFFKTRPQEFLCMSTVRWGLSMLQSRLPRIIQFIGEQDAITMAGGRRNLTVFFT